MFTVPEEVTMGPLHVPPAGVPASCNGIDWHSDVSLPAFACEGEMTDIIAVSRLVQEWASVYEYDSMKLPTADGVKLPDGVIPIPVHVPPVGVPVS